MECARRGRGALVGEPVCGGGVVHARSVTVRRSSSARIPLRVGGMNPLNQIVILHSGHFRMQNSKLTPVGHKALLSFARRGVRA